jgi:murein DD-endopeptidase MepM/ murein hydrolase activator NlpD
MVAWVLFLFLLVPVGGGLGGYYLGLDAANPSPHSVSASLESEIRRQRNELAEAKRSAQEDLNALALKLGQLQAHVMRLDALGERITRMSELDDGEFDFGQPPAQGGPLAEPGESAAVPVQDFMTQLNELAQRLEDREEQLQVLESMLRSHSLQEQIVPGGRPIKSGWLSSYYGIRTDPFTGKKAFHGGVDFAGKEGSEVVAVASGVVTWAGDRWGYGKLVEINHGKGYATRYAHSKDILVKLGQRVNKGDVVATMGSTGRSTGPHVHFEVLRNGRAVDPAKYIQAAR